MDFLRRDDWTWAAIVVAGGMLVLGCLVPAFALAVEAGTDSEGGAASYRYTEDVNVAWDAGPLGVAALLGGVLVVAAGLAGLAARRGRARTKGWLAGGVLAVSIGLLLLLGFATSGLSRWTSDADLYPGQDSGPLVEAAVDRLQDEGAASSEARDPRWHLVGGEHRYGIGRRGGWTALSWSTLALYWLGAYRVARLRLGPWLAALTVVATSAAGFVWLFLRFIDALEP